MTQQQQQQVLTAASSASAAAAATARETRQPHRTEQQHQQVQQEPSPPSPRSLSLLNIVQLCDRLWRLVDTNDRREGAVLGGGSSGDTADSSGSVRIVQVLDAICAAFYRELPNSYDPSEVFLAVQGAALQATAKLQQLADDNGRSRAARGAKEERGGGGGEEDARKAGGGGDGEDESEQQQREGSEYNSMRQQREVVYKSLFAMAAMCRVCVGPAWWKQTYQRRDQLRQRGQQQHRRRQAESPSAAADPPGGRRQHGQGEDGDSSQATASTGGESEVGREGETSADGGGLPPPSSFIRAAASSAGRSCSPVTQQSSLFVPPSYVMANSSAESNIQYPSIPEVLPAAILKFAANLSPSKVKDDDGVQRDCNSTNCQTLMFQYSASLVQAQMVLVQSLCCKPDASQFCSAQDWIEAETSVRRHEWLIPGVYEEIGAMVLYWLSLVTTRTKVASDGNNPISSFSCNSPSLRLAITRACNDLISAGWCPDQSTVGVSMVRMLINIAQDASEVRVAPTICSSAREATLASKEEADSLMAWCGGTEAVSTLTALSLQGLIPTSTIPSLIKTASRLYWQVFPPSASHLYGSQASTVIAVADERLSEIDTRVKEALKTQRDACFSDLSEILWKFLSSNTMAVTTVETLLTVIDTTNFDSENCVLSTADSVWGDSDTAACVQAAGAVRVISSALWGDPPETPSIPLLRVYWRPVLEALLSCLSSCYKAVTHFDMQSTGKTNRAAHDLSDLVSEMLLALAKAIESEIRGGSARLSILEWECMVVKLDDSVVSWLRLVYDASSGSRNGSIHFGVATLIALVCDFLDHCCSFENVPFVEYDLLEHMSLVLLQKAVPYLDAKQAKLLGSAALRSWACFGLFPHRLDGWNETACHLLNEAFRKEETGQYAHDPVVRLEALKALTETTSCLSDDFKDSRRTCEASIKRAPSLLELTQHLREQHLEFINGSIIPVLKNILLSQSTCTSPGRQTNFQADDIASLPHDAGMSTAKEFADALACRVNISSSKSPVEALALYAVRLTGRLYRGISGMVSRSRCYAAESSSLRFRSYTL